MKGLILIFTAVLSLNTLAQETYYCWETNDAGTRTDRLVVLTQEGSERMQEGRVYNFKYEFYQEDTACFPDVETVAFAEVEDVMFRFRVKGRRIQGIIYWDQLDESWIKINGKRSGLECHVE